MYDVIIVGGGPAGLSAALMLGRCRRSVLVIDSGEPRNAVAKAMHGYLSRDGTNPRELQRLGREESTRYGVGFIDARVKALTCQLADLTADISSSFVVKLEDGRSLYAQKVLLATGIKDVLPEIEGAAQYYGSGIYHCPYCDGWEYSDKRLCAYGKDGKDVCGMALGLQTWSPRVLACIDGGVITREEEQTLREKAIEIRTEPVVRFAGSEGEHGHLERIVFAEGPDEECDALFFNTCKYQSCELATSVGCTYDDKGKIFCTDHQCTGVRGLFVAGDASGGVEFVIAAAAEGASAAVAINRELQAEFRVNTNGKAPLGGDPDLLVTEET